jgi:hypothetical protein
MEFKNIVNYVTMSRARDYVASSQPVTSHNLLLVKFSNTFSILWFFAAAFSRRKKKEKSN